MKLHRFVMAVSNRVSGSQADCGCSIACSCFSSQAVGSCEPDFDCRRFLPEAIVEAGTGVEKAWKSEAGNVGAHSCA